MRRIWSILIFDIVATTTYVSTNNFNENANIAGADATGAVLFRREDRRLVPRLPEKGSRARFRGGIASDPYGRRFALLTDCDVLEQGKAPAEDLTDLTENGSCPSRTRPNSQEPVPTKFN